MKIYLASKSPRRQELLTQIGVEFECISVETDEQALPQESAQAYVERVAKNKAQAGWSCNQRVKSMPVLSADTSVVIGQQILGKPDGPQEALTMLKSLSGNTHQVLTCVVVTNGNQILTKTSVTDVSFAKIEEAQLLKYIATNDCFDKAGAYGIQGYAARFVESISGSYSGVVGLPLFETSQLLEQF
jgi:septum formation protein